MNVRLASARLLLGAGLAACALSACRKADEPERVERPLTEVMNGSLQEAITAENPWIRAETLRLMSLSGAPEWRDTLRAGLQDAHAVVRASAIEALLPAGDAEAQAAALSLIVQGDSQAKSRLLDLILVKGTPEFRVHAASTLLRDRSPEIRRATLLHIRDIGLPLDPALREQLINDSDNGVADAAFAWLVAVDSAGALERVLTGLRSSDADRRAKALEFSRHMATADLWPTMRAYLQSGDSQSRFAAECVLGQLGDPTVEEALRTVILTGSEGDAALALRSISHIRTERALTQVERQIDDPRVEVRSAALDILLERHVPPSAVEPFLADEDPSLGMRALAYMISTDVPWAVARLGRMLSNEDNVLPVLRSLYEATNRLDSDALIAELAPQLEALSNSPDVQISDLASRLRLQAAVGAPLPASLPDDWPSGRLYATVESLLPAPGPEQSNVLAQAARHDLLMVRVAAAIAIRQLGSAFVAPEG